MSPVPDKVAMARGTVLGLAVQALSLALPLVLIPYIVWKLTLTVYGLWTALNLVGLWLAQVELGLGNAVTRAAAGRWARGDLEGLRRLRATWLWFDLGAGAVTASAAILAGEALLRRFVPAADAGAVFPALVLVALNAALTPVTRHHLATLYGLQRFASAGWMSLSVLVLSAGSLVLLLEAGWGLLGLAANALGWQAIQLGILMAILRKQGYPGSLSPRSFRASELGELAAFGWKLQAGHVLMTILRSDRLLLSTLGASPALVAIYQLGAGLAERSAATVGILSSTLFPAAANLESQGDRERLRRMFLRGVRYHALAAMGLLGFAFLFAEEILVLWMGRPLPEAAAVLRVMAIGGYAAAVGSSAQAVGVGMGRAGWQLASCAAGVLAAAFLYMALGRRYDYLGLAGSVSAGWVVVQIVFMIGFRRFVTFSWREWVGNAVARPLAVAVPAGLLFLAWRALAAQLPAVESRGPALVVVASAFSLAAVLAWICLRAARVLDAYDLDLLKSIVRRSDA